mgnify:CR=1 FL=1
MIFSRRKKVETDRLPMPIVGYDEIVLANHGTCLWNWHFEDYKEQALQQLDDMTYARGLGLRNQAMLNAREVVKTAFRDYSEGNGLEAKEMTLHQLSDNWDTGLFRIDDFIDHLWYMHSLDSKSVRLPRQALDAINVMQDFPQAFIQDMKILEAVKRHPVKDYRFTDERRPYFAPAIIVMPDPILAVKSVDQWYSVLRWE